MQPEEYGSFLMRLWYARQDGDRQRAGHAEVEHIQSGSRWSFLTCDTLLAFLGHAARRMQPPDDRRLTMNGYTRRSTMARIHAGGNIRIMGASEQTPTPMFVHVAGEVNTRGNQTVIDHPMTNDDPHAILFVTRRQTLLFNQTDDRPISPPHAESFSVAYSSRAAKWLILQPGGSSIPPGAAFNVLVFKV